MSGRLFILALAATALALSGCNTAARLSEIGAVPP
jgi:predicted small secreted protein